jgi:pilus assembly protein CpaE
MRIARGMASFVILDLPHLWAPWIQDALLDATELVLVTNPDLPGMRDIKNLSEAAKAGGASDGARLVLNKVGMARKTEISAKDFETQINLPPAVSIPYEPILFGTAMNNGEFLSKAGKSSKVSAEISKLVEVVSGSQRLSKAESKAKVKQAKTRKRSALSALKFAR